MNKKDKIRELVPELFSDDDCFNPHVKIVKVCWDDANTNRSDLWLRDVIKQKLLPAETIGYLLHEDEEKVIVCGFWFWDENTDILDMKGESVFKDVHTIPKSQIRNILVLKIDFEESNKLRNKLHSSGTKEKN